MNATLRYVGLDVHKDSIVIALAEEGASPAEVLGTISWDIARLLKVLRKLGPTHQLRCCYEAGPTGYGLYRALSEAGIDCQVVAPSLIPVQSGQRVKTDRRDACKLAHFLRSGDLTSVWVPDEVTEAMRDLERARDDAKRTERVARQQLSKFLLRHGRRCPLKTSWTQSHLAWIAQQTFERPAQQVVLTDYLHTVEEATARVKRLTAQIAQLVKDWAFAPLVERLMALRGVQLVTAVTLVAEIGDLRRFTKARQLMAYLGVVPSERSSGGCRRQGRITKTGNGHARRALVEAAWSYRFAPRMSRAIRLRNEDLPPDVRAVAWAAQLRVHWRMRKLIAAGKPANVAVTAVARELAGFVWAIGQLTPSPLPGSRAGRLCPGARTPSEAAPARLPAASPRPKPPGSREARPKRGVTSN